MTPPRGSVPEPLVQSPEPGRHPGQMPRLRPLGLFPGLELGVLIRLSPGQGCKTVWPGLGRARKKPQVVLCGLTVMGTGGDAIDFILLIRYIIFHMRKI